MIAHNSSNEGATDISGPSKNSNYTFEGRNLEPILFGHQINDLARNLSLFKEKQNFWPQD